MANEFGKGFLSTFDTGVKLGASGYERIASQRQDAQKLLDEQKKKIAENNLQQKAMAEMLGVPLDADPVTGELTYKIPDNFQFTPPTDAKVAQYFPQIGNENQQAYNSMLTNYKKETTPDYILTRSEFNPDTGKGQIVAFNRKTKKMDVLAEDPTYQPKKVSTDVIEGKTDINGQEYGKSGRRTRVIRYENGKVDTIDLGRVHTSSAGGDKPVSQLDFELNLADYQERVDNVKNKRNTYLSGNFADPQARDAYKEGINSDLNELALGFAKLASKPMQQHIVDTFKTGNKLIAEGKKTRKAFYDEEKQKLEEEYIEGKWGKGQDAYQDVLSMQKFLETKYGLYLDYEDAKKNKDSALFDDILNNTKLGE